MYREHFMCLVREHSMSSVETEAVKTARLPEPLMDALAPCRRECQSSLIPQACRQEPRSLEAMMQMFQMRTIVQMTNHSAQRRAGPGVHQRRLPAQMNHIQRA